MILKALQCICMGQSLLCQVIKWGRGSKGLPLGGCAGHCQCIDVCLSSQQEIKKREDGKIAKKHQYEIKVILS